MADATPKAGTAESRYSSLLTFRDPFLRRGWDCSELTIPSLLPRNGRTSYANLVTPWQGAGARCVNNLAAKMLMAALPPNTPIFRLRIDELLLVKHQVNPEEKSKFDAGLGVIERAVMTEVEMAGDRVSVFEAIKHLLVAGNVLLHDSKESLRVYHLSNYVVRRDPSGNPLEIIASEQIDPVVLPGSHAQVIEEHKQKNGAGKPITLYTHVNREKTHWTVYQEACGVEVPGLRGTYPIDKCPWLPLRFTRIDGEDYGRSYVEEYLGDFRSLEDLSQALVEGARAAAKLLILVRPGSSTKLSAVTNAVNGAAIAGSLDDVGVLQMDKFHDFQTAEKQARVLEERLAYAFLLHSSIQRNAERVTAEEIRYMAQELETTLGGFYTVFSQEFQLPYIRVKMARMQREGRLPALPKGVVRPTIVTGIEALGRGNDRTKLINYAQALSTVFGPEGAAGMLDGPEFATRLATADGIDTKGLIKSNEQIVAEQQQQQLAMMMEKLGPNAITTGGKLLAEGAAPAAQAAGG